MAALSIPSPSLPPLPIEQSTVPGEIELMTEQDELAIQSYKDEMDLQAQDHTEAAQATAEDDAISDVMEGIIDTRGDIPGAKEAQDLLLIAQSSDGVETQMQDEQETRIAHSSFDEPPPMPMDRQEQDIELDPTQLVEEAVSTKAQLSSTDSEILESEYKSAMETQPSDVETLASAAQSMKVVTQSEDEEEENQGSEEPSEQGDMDTDEDENSCREDSTCVCDECIEMREREESRKAEESKMKHKLERLRRDLAMKECEVRKLKELLLKKEQSERQRKIKERPQKLSWTRIPKKSLMDLPNEVLENCFSLDQDLSLWDHIQLSGTCKAFRNAYDDLAWKSLYEKHVLTSGAEVVDGHCLHAKPGAGDAELAIGGREIFFKRALAAYASKAVYQTSRTIKFNSSSSLNRPEYDRRIAMMVDKYTDLQRRLNSTPDHPTSTPHFHSPYPPSQYDQEWWKAEQARRKEVYTRRTALWEPFALDCSQFMMEHLLPFSRAELWYRGGGSEQNLMLGTRLWSYTPYNVLCLRHVNFPVLSKTDVMAQTGLLSMEVVSLLKPVPKELVTGSTTKPKLYYYKKDAERLAVKMSNILDARRAVSAAQHAVAELTVDLKMAEEDHKRGMCEYCLRYVCGCDSGSDDSASNDESESEAQSS